MSRPLVFISYAQPDADKAFEIAELLRAHEVDTWIDRTDLETGHVWKRQIRDAIERSDFVVLCISSASLQSKWVLEELRLAILSQKRLPEPRVILVLLGQVSELSLPPELQPLEYIDFSRPSEQAEQRLLAAVRRRVPAREPLGLDAEKLAENIAAEVAQRLGLARPLAATEGRSHDRELVFVVCAFTPDMEPVFEGIKAAADAHSLKALRVKDVQGDYKITDKVISMIRGARIVVVDLSHERPNVYFELGYARGLGRRVVTIARAGTTVHFDVKDWVYMEYSDSRTLERDLKKRFEYELSAGDATA